jgi:hypothetical protein
MLLKSARVHNFKCFMDSGEARFDGHWTVVVGQNNAGKSTFLSTLKPGGLVSSPYRGVDTNPDLPPNTNSKLEFEVEITGPELKRCLLNSNQAFFWCHDHLSHIAFEMLHTVITPKFQNLIESGRLSLDGQFNTGQGFVEFGLSTEEGEIVYPGNRFCLIVPNADRNDFNFGSVNQGAQDSHISSWFGQLLGQSIYKFDAERMHIGTSTVDNVTSLNENGANLAQVLLKLKENDYKFSEFLSRVREVLPSITGVVPAVLQPGQVSVEIQFHDPNLNRPDLNMALRECGTGTSQVLCILYVVVTSRYPKIIIIDEPNSFLHPGASKRLIEVLKSYTQHQFIIATHSPELIQVADPDNLLLIRWSNAGSVVSDIDRDNIEEVRFALGELGVGLSDVFGLDRAIWVEGPTEAACFPLLLRNAGLKENHGVGFIPIRTVGDVTGSQKVAFFEMYRSLVTTSKILPTAVAFSLDSEDLTELQKNDLKRQLGNSLYFLPRRCFENYLLHSAALAVLFETLGEKISVSQIDEFFGQKRQKKKHENWLLGCDGARVLKELFSSLTDTRHQYSKVRHGKFLVEWIMKNDKEFLSELSAYVINLCEGAYDRLAEQ